MLTQLAPARDPSSYGGSIVLFCLIGLLGGIAAADDPPQPAETPAREPEKPRAERVRSLFDGKTLKGWRVVDKNDFDLHGKVRVVNNEIHLEGGGPATGIASTEKIPRVDYELTLEAQRVKGNDFFCGVTFPVKDKYCTLIIGGWGGDVTGLSNVDDFSAIENETTGYRQFENARWYGIRLRVTEKKIEAWIDKEKIVDLETKNRKLSIWFEQEPVCPLGIATWNTSAALRNLRLKTW